MKELTHKQLNAFILEYNDTLKLKGYSNLKRNQKKTVNYKTVKKIKE